MSLKFYKFLFPIFLLFCSYSNQISITSTLSQIPEDDREKLENFFSYLMLEEAFAYTLFGSKPMSTIGHDKTTPSSYKDLYDHPLFELESWWEIWEKYKDLFPMDQYSLFTRNDDVWFQIFFINKANFLNIISANLQFFQEKIGGKFTVNEIFNHIVSSDDLLSIGLNNSHALFGLLLGYGKENSKRFEEYYSQKSKNIFPPKFSYEMVNEEDGVLMIPHFASFSKKETNKIIKNYKKERALVLNNYSKGDFLEVTINKLISNNPD